MLDTIDRALVDALCQDGRVRFNRIAEVLGVSPQTIARRYRRLQEEASLRVVGKTHPGPTGRAEWLLRVSATPRVAQDLATVLARRPDMSRVNVTSGGTQIVGILETDAVGSDYPLFLRELPSTEGVVAVDAARILHTYLGGASVWPGQTRELSLDQRGRLAGDAEEESTADPEGTAGTGRRSRGPALADVDRTMLAVLNRDGRASLTELAARTGASAVTIARRLEELRSSGVLFFDVDIDPRTLGAGVRTLLWMSVPPAELDAVARDLATHEQPAFVAALTGSFNLVAMVLTPDSAGLHTYLTEELGRHPAISRLETSPVLRNLKGAGSTPGDPLRAAAEPRRTQSAR